jgi:flagellar biosynthesis protein FliR
VLRGAIPAETEEAGILAGLYAFAALVAALGLSAHLGVVRLIVDSLQIAPLGSEISDLGSSLRSLADWMFQAFELGVTLGAPLLLSAWLAALLCGLLLRAAGPIVAPWPSTLLPWFGLAIVCLSIAGTLDEIPGVVRLFSRETRRVLEALH